MNASATLKVVLVLTAFLAGGFAQEPVSFAKHPFFKHLIGNWKVEGELQGLNGDPVKVTQEWKGIATAEGTFVMEGTRKINDITQDYRWTINLVGGLYEVALEVKGDETTIQRFEASVSEVAMTMERNGFLTAGGAKISLKDYFTDDTYQVLKSDVAFTDDQGNPTLTGTLTHKRVEKP